MMAAIFADHSSDGLNSDVLLKCAFVSRDNQLCSFDGFI